MTKVDTRLYTIEVPDLFEKVVQFGQLLRAERMDREKHESSFAELNLFVGLTDEEKLEHASSAEPGEVLDELLARNLEQERELGPLPEDFQQVTEQSELRRSVLWRIAPTSWRPDSGRFVDLQALPGTAPLIFASLTLEFDWSLRETYSALWRELTSSLTWKNAALASEGIGKLKTETYSIFDNMPPARRDAIVSRYREILGGLQPEHSETPATPSLVNLVALDAAEVTAERFVDALAPYEEDHGDVLLRTKFLPNPITLTCYLDRIDRAELGARAARLALALKGLGPAEQTDAARHLWDNCKLNFEATDYGAGDESNEDFFGIHGPDEALAQVGAGSVYLDECWDEDSSGPELVFAISFYPPWEDEHGCALVVRGGKVVAWTMPGDSLDEWSGGSTGQPSE